MNESGIPPENVSSLINEVLKNKDPATVGLKRILRRKEEENKDYPLRGVALQEFTVPGQENKTFNEDERHVLELEKKVAELQVELKKQKGKASQAIQAAYAKGKNEGMDEGKQEGTAVTTEVYEKKIDALREEITSFLEDLEISRRKIFQNTEHILLRLCSEMVKKIVGREVAKDDRIVLFTIKKALQHVGQKERMVIRVALDDFELVSGQKDFWAPVGERLTDIIIEPDSAITKGGCIIDSNAGVVDATLGVQFSEISELIETIWEDVSSSDRQLHSPDDGE